jgi:hypothetical protein
MALQAVLLEDAGNVLFEIDLLLGIGGQQRTSDQGQRKYE